MFGGISAAAAGIANFLVVLVLIIFLVLAVTAARLMRPRAQGLRRRHQLSTRRGQLVGTAGTAWLRTGMRDDLMARSLAKESNTPALPLPASAKE